MAGVVAMGVWGFVYFGLLDTKAAGLIFLAIFLSLIPHDAQYGPQAALIAESYTGRLRYSGASLRYQLASVFAGGPAPIIATLLFAGVPGHRCRRHVRRQRRRRRPRGAHCGQRWWLLDDLAAFVRIPFEPAADGQLFDACPNGGAAVPGDFAAGARANPAIHKHVC